MVLNTKMFAKYSLQYHTGNLTSFPTVSYFLHQVFHQTQTVLKLPSIDHIEGKWTYSSCLMEQLIECTITNHIIAYLLSMYWPVLNKTRAWFKIKLLTYQYRKSHCGDKTVLRMRDGVTINNISHWLSTSLESALCYKLVPLSMFTYITTKVFKLFSFLIALFKVNTSYHNIPYKWIHLLTKQPPK